MQQQVRTTVIFGAIIAIASGLTGAYASGFFVNDEVNATSFAQNSFMTGHLEMTVKDANGHIKAYRQSDNVIVDSGEDCAAMLLFGRNGTAAATGNSNCAGGTTSYNVIAIGNRTGSADEGATALGTDIAMFNEHNATTLGIGFERVLVNTPAFTFPTGLTGAQVVLSNEFNLDTTNISGSQVIVDESGLFNSTTPLASGMFAHQTFTAVPVDNGESLTVEWTINIGGVGAITGTGETP